MNTAIYKLDHFGDPDFHTGVFGSRGCVPNVRKGRWVNIIGIGGMGERPTRKGVANKVIWIGLGRRPFAMCARNAPIFRFVHFAPLSELPSKVLDIRKNYPALAAFMYDVNRRSVTHVPGGNSTLDREVSELLQLAAEAPPSKWGVCKTAA